MGGFLHVCPDAALILDDDGLVVVANRQAADLHQFASPVDLAGRPFANLVEIAQRDHVAAALRRVQTESSVRGIEYRLCRRDGSTIVAEMSAAVCPDDSGESAGILVTVRDIGSRTHGDATLRQSERYLATIFDLAPVGMAVADMDGRFVKTNRALQRMLQYSEEEMHGMHWSVTCHPDDVAIEDELDEKLVAGEIDQYTLESRCIRKDGEILWGRETVSEVRNEQGDAIFAIAILEDITERKAMEDALVHQALHDALTGLPNRVLFRDRVDQAIAGARREARSAAVLLLDLDRFKELNDTLGHHQGDSLLQQFATRLQGLLRVSDTVARLGGDEFAVLLADANEVDAVTVAGKIRQVLTRPFHLEDHIFLVDASVGIALFPQHGDTIDALLRHADVAMYVAKRGSRGHAVYASHQDEHLPEHFLLTGDLRRAIDGTGLELYYQPKVRLDDGMVCGVEALLRWHHPQRGDLSPEQFIPLAEHAGLVRALTTWAITEAVRQQRAWKESGIDLDIAVNLSTGSLQDWELVQTVTRLVHVASGDIPRLTLEITEGAIMSDPGHAMEIVSRLHDLGIRVALDDFGTGYSSLGYLKRLPLDEIKIDGSFVMAMMEGDDGALVVRSAVDLGHNLSLAVVAEGVENAETLRSLRALGCDVAQGFLWSEPRPASDLMQWLGDHAPQVAAAGA